MGKKVLSSTQFNTFLRRPRQRHYRYVLGQIDGVGRTINQNAYFPNPNGWHRSARFCGFRGR